VNTNDLDREVMNQDATFILGTSLAGWIAGLALCVSILLLAAAPTAITQAFALGTLISTLILSAWLTRRLKNNR
jgi:uncharacterized MnhB-related membrane protein